MNSIASLWDRIQEFLAEARERTVGAVLEALAQRRAARDAATFSIALIALSAKMAKADGVVTDEETEAFHSFFQYPPDHAPKVRMIFNLAKEDVAGFDHYARQVRRLFQDDTTVLEDVLDCLYHVALADGGMHQNEQAMLDAVAEIFELAPCAVWRIRTANLGVSEDDPYAVLGIDPCATPDELRSVYRRLARENHPDALVARGVPEHLVRIAEGRMATINAAYERAQRERPAMA